MAKGAISKRAEDCKREKRLSVIVIPGLKRLKLWPQRSLL